MKNQSAFRLGLVGHPVSHSQSPQLFQRFFEDFGHTNARYELFDIPQIEQLQDFLAAQQLAEAPLIGFNVTVPHKVAIIPLLSSISLEAQAVGAVNTVLIKPEPTGIELHGYNTDVAGFDRSFKWLCEQTQQPCSNVVIIGNGGSAKSVTFVLEQQQIPYVVWHRNQCFSQQGMETNVSMHIEPNTLFVHTTPVGMWPNVEDCIDLTWIEIKGTHRLIDLVYNPAETQLMQHFLAAGAFAMNGKYMLEQQAIAAWTLFQSNLP